jgi:hypothetical protein
MVQNGLLPYQYIGVHIRTGDKVFGGINAEGVFIPWQKYLSRAVSEAKRRGLSIVYLATDTRLVRDFAISGYPEEIYGIKWILEEENGNFNPKYAPFSETSFQSYRWAIRNFEIFANAAMFVCATQSFYAMPAYALRGGSSTLNTVDYHKNTVYNSFP